MKDDFVEGWKCVGKDVRGFLRPAYFRMGFPLSLIKLLVFPLVEFC